jgi:hypothetical protein
MILYEQTQDFSGLLSFYLFKLKVLKNTIQIMIKTIHVVDKRFE